MMGFPTTTSPRRTTEQWSSEENTPTNSIVVALGPTTSGRGSTLRSFVASSICARAPCSNAAYTSTSTTAPVVAQLDVTVVSVEVPAGATTTAQGQAVLQTTAHDHQGAMVIGVLPHSPATAVLHQGDVITTCNTVPVHNASDLNSCANAAGAARTLCLTLARHGALLTTNVVLTKKP